MLDLALQSKDEATLIKDISRRQDISELYLEQLFTPLKSAGFIRSIRGRNGGFLLAKSPSDIRFIDIVQTMDGSTAPVDCIDDASICSRSGFCLTREVWVEMKKAIDKVLESTTLEDLITGKRTATPDMLAVGSPN